LKYSILEILKNAKTHKSGEEISRQLGVTRAMIWKSVKALREEGYDIAAVRGKGYYINESADILNKHEIGKGLFGTDVIYFEELGSTNTYMKELAAGASMPEGTCVVCENQTKGRGRMGRQWFSPDSKNISMSLLLRPDIPPFMAPAFSIFAGVCVYEVLKRYVDENIRIKWPNDILVNNKKVCGILTEMSSEQDKTEYIVIGTGINVRGSTKNMPPEIRSAATTLESVVCKSAVKIHRADIIRGILERFELYYPENKKGVTKQIFDKWKCYSDAIGRKIEYYIDKRAINGEIVDIDKSGALLVKSDSGIETVHAGMIFELER
jgi:BirA family transcriptional regulator, biotin operon repressor / biotin---[acetyl-CoA-carboxylase] ligase